MAEYGYQTVVSPDIDDSVVIAMCSERLRAMAERDGYVLTSEPRMVGSDAGWMDLDDPEPIALPMEFAPHDAKPNVRNVRFAAEAEPVRPGSAPDQSAGLPVTP